MIQYTNQHEGNEIQGQKALGNSSIVEITALVCRILESNDVLHKPITTEFWIFWLDFSTNSSWFEVGESEVRLVVVEFDRYGGRKIFGL